jgi:hypothetical protein
MVGTAAAAIAEPTPRTRPMRRSRGSTCKVGATSIVSSTNPGMR